MPWLLLALALSGCTSSAPPPLPGKQHSATVTWKASVSKVSGYHVYRAAKQDEQPGLVAVTPPDVTEYVDQAVEAGHTYYYSVKSFGANGVESISSEKVTASIPAN
jgi:fibronectin type 3 domain-containing protein